MDIAFIGLGNMGGGMAANLVARGHRVHAFDLNPHAVDRAVAAGCLSAPDPAPVFAAADVVVTMLPSGAHVRDVYDTAIAGHAPASALVIDCSTIDVATARSLGEHAAAHGRDLVDAPVSGGTAAADAGTLTFMVGGTAQAFARARPVLESMGRAVIHAGGAGAGQAAKICNNMLLGATMVATCEAFTLAQKLGLDAQTFFDISSKASGQSWSMTSYCPVPGPVPASPANRGYDGGFATALMLKDLKLAVEAAQGVGASVPMGAAAGSLYQAFANLGGAGRDFSAIIQLLDGSWPAARDPRPPAGA